MWSTPQTLLTDDRNTAGTMTHGPTHGLRFRRKVVRDLIWVITSPHLVDAAQFPVFPVAFGAQTVAQASDWLDGLERDPSALIAFLQGACVCAHEQ